MFGNNIYLFFMKKTLALLVGLFIFLAGAQTVFAQYGLKETGTAAFGATPSGSVSGIIGNVIGAGLTFVGVLFLVLMIYGGITWMLARGNEQQSKKALDTIIAAVIGLVIVLGSYALTNFVFSSVEGQPTSSATGCFDSETLNLAACGPSVNCSVFQTSADCLAEPNQCCVWQQ